MNKPHDISRHAHAVYLLCQQGGLPMLLAHQYRREVQQLTANGLIFLDGAVYRAVEGRRLSAPPPPPLPDIRRGMSARLPPELIDAVDAHAKALGGKSRTDALEDLLTRGLRDAAKAHRGGSGGEGGGATGKAEAATSGTRPAVAARDSSRPPSRRKASGER